MNAVAVIEKIKKQAKESTSEVRFVRTVSAGDEVRQGDVYLWPCKHPSGKAVTHSRHQLAPGNTKGSRHIAVGRLKVWAPDKSAGPLVGPVIESDERFFVEHPEHANISLPSGCYQVGYQRDYEMEEIQRVAD